MKNTYLLIVLLAYVFPVFADEKVADGTATASKAAFYSRFSTSPEKLQAQLAGAYDSRCVGDHEDPMDFGTVMQSGKLRGECQDLSGNRPIAILTGDENSDTLTIANLRYKGRFWIATFKKNSIAKVHFEIINFGDTTFNVLGHQIKSVTAHTQVRFEFNEPIQLENQVVSDTVPADKEQLTDLTITYNAFGVTGIPYDIWTGLNGTFGLVGKVIATVDRSVEEIINDKSQVQMYDMDFSHVSELNHRSAEENMYHYFVVNLQHSQHMGYKSVYHTTLRNCTTEAFDVMDLAFPELLAGNAPGSRAVNFLASYSPTKTARVTVDQWYESLFGRFGSHPEASKFVAAISERPFALAADAVMSHAPSVHDYKIAGVVKNSLGTIENINDLVIIPSLQNLLDRQIVPDDGATDLKKWDQEHVSYLNSEPVFNSTDDLCAAAGTCTKPNFRNPEFPRLLPIPKQ